MKENYMKIFLIALFLMAIATSASAQEATTTVYILESNGTIGNSIGTITFKDSKKGLEITTNLTNLPAGEHGFHIHENPSCEAGQKDGKTVPGLKAGGHYDPKNTNKHAGPTGDGHLGDLPILVVSKAGNVQTTLYAPRLTVKDIINRSVMIHVGGDNYSDNPAVLGGGGSRMACGVIK